MVDVPRTAPEVAFFHQAPVQKSLERILYIWGVRCASCAAPRHALRCPLHQCIRSTASCRRDTPRAALTRALPAHQGGRPLHTVPFRYCPRHVHLPRPEKHSAFTPETFSLRDAFRRCIWGVGLAQYSAPRRSVHCLLSVFHPAAHPSGNTHSESLHWDRLMQSPLSIDSSIAAEPSRLQSYLSAVAAWGG